MRYLYIYLGLLLLSCGQKSTDKPAQIEVIIKDSVKINSSPPIVVQPTQNIELMQTELHDKVFEIGSKTDLTDNCKFYFECDCCSGDLIFNSDSSFNYISYCVADVSYTSGTYSVINDTIKLLFSGHSITEAYNWDYETDSTATEFTITDTTLAPATFHYIAELCNDKFKLSNLDYDEVAMQTRKDYRSTVTELESYIVFEPDNNDE